MYIYAMKKENLFHSFEILVREYGKFPMPMHQHTFFVLCYIMFGSGIFTSDAYAAEFQSGTLLLVKPGIKHVYELAERTRLIYIRFSEHYLKPYFTHSERELLYYAPETGMSDWNDKEYTQLISMARCIETEDASSFPDIQLCQWWANSIIRICMRRIRSDMAGKETVAEQERKSMLIMQYIQSHLRQPELLRLKNLGEQFNLSGNYIGKYFKACCGESLKNYILRCRLLEAERLLVQTDMNISEIAASLGFTDESHLSHAFKRSKNMTPREFRKGRR